MTIPRRAWLLGGAGIAAAAAGIALQRREAAAPPASPPAPDPIGDPTGPGQFWQMRFPKPDGTELAIASLRGQPLLLNFWGTWCPPCVKEMPELDQFAREFAPQGWRVIGLAVDNPKAVREFLTKTPVSYTIALAGFEGTELATRLGNTQSGLPYTVAFDKAGAVRQRKAGATTLAELRTWVKSA
jgi:thiol-disulfide isomerase/thioredoxin